MANNPKQQHLNIYNIHAEEIYSSFSSEKWSFTSAREAVSAQSSWSAKNEIYMIKKHLSKSLDQSSMNMTE